MLQGWSPIAQAVMTSPPDKEWLKLWIWVWTWLTKEGASRATVILVFITAWYVLLTHRMAKAMSRQTGAMTQPVLSMDIFKEKDEVYPKGQFRVKNLGAQPAVILDLRLSSWREHIVVFQDYIMYQRHILPPGADVTFTFDLTTKYKDKGFQWFSSGAESFNLEVVACDLAEEIVLAYKTHEYYKSLFVKRGMPLRLRWRFFYTPFRQWYFRILYRFKPPKIDRNPNEALKLGARTFAWLRRISSRLGRHRRA